MGKKLAYIRQRAEDLATARPTAVNLRWAIQRIERLILSAGEDPDFSKVLNDVLDEARRIQEEDQQLCKKIGENGSSILPDGDLLTHCNTGALATGGIGTALGVIVTAWEQGRRFHVYADETRPLLQGARLTAWELTQRKIRNCACRCSCSPPLKTGKIGSCIVGADRIINGDTANKIGTVA